LSITHDFHKNQLQDILILLQGVNKFIVAYFRIFDRYGLMAKEETVLQGMIDKLIEIGRSMAWK
jgi:hypothetical protein